MAAQKEVALSLTALGHVAVVRGDPANGRERYQAARAIYQALGADKSDDPALLLEFVVVNDRLGDVYGTLGQPELALAAQRTSLASAERIVQADPASPRAKRNVVILRNKIGVTPSFPGEGVDARVSPEEMLAFEELAKADPKSASAQHDLLIGRLGLGNEMTARGELAAALAAYRAALAIVERLADADPDNALLFVDVVFCQNQVGHALLRSGDAAGAVREHEAALVVAQRLALTDGSNARLEQDLAHTWTRLGDAKLAAGDVAGALAAKRAALALTEKLAAAGGDPGSSDAAQAHLARTLGYYADGLRAAGERDEARKQIARARAILAPLLAKSEVPKAWAELPAWLTTLEQAIRRE